MGVSRIHLRPLQDRNEGVKQDLSVRR